MPFCKQCGAPQIRVVGIESPPSHVTETSGSSSDHAIDLPVLLPQPGSNRVQWSQALPSAALGGAFSLLLLIPLSALSAGFAAAPFLVFGLAFLAGGAWSVRLYRRKIKGTEVTPTTGAQVGAASGGFGFLFFAVMVVAMTVYRADELRKLMSESAPQLVNRGYDAEKMQQMLDLLKTPGGLAFFVAFGLFAMLLLFVVGSTIGGAWYGAWTRKRVRR
jgi:hypothetical protein